MPSVSRSQQRFMFAELAKKKKGEKGKTKMTPTQLAEFTKTKTKGLPEKVKPKKKKGK